MRRVIVRHFAKLGLPAAIAFAVLLAACSSNGGEATESDTAAAAVASHSAEQYGLSSSLCLTCHSRPGLTATSIWGGERQVQAVSPFGFYTSVHRDVPCTECHSGQASLPHERFTADGVPIVGPVDASEVCRSCHAGAAERFLDSVHGTVIRLGDERAPGCTDCHSAHYVQPIENWAATAKATACSKCHDGADAAFAGALTHREPSPSRLAIDYYATRFFGMLVVAVVGIGILHVELDLLRWLKEKVWRGNGKGK